MSTDVKRWKQKMKVEQTLHQTTNYGMFKYIPQNRKVVSTHVANLIQSIKTKNLNKDFPIIVNERMEILDGQNRFEALQQLELPVWYKISYEMSIQDISLVNTVSKKWSNDDFLHRYSMQGKEHYLKLRHFMEWANIKSVNIAIKILKNIKFDISKSSTEQGSGLGGSDIMNFKTGCFKYPENDSFAKKTVLQLKDLSQYTIKKDPYDRSLVVAYDCIRKDKSFDIDRLTSKLKSYPIGVYRDANSLIDQFEKAYNYNVKDDKNKIFLKRAA